MRRRDPAVDRGCTFAPGTRVRGRGRVPRADEGRRSSGRGALERNGRGSAGRLVRGPAGDLPERGRPGECPCGDEARVRVALQRSRHFVPGPPGLRPFRRSAFGRRAAHGAERPGVERRHVHARYRIGFPGCRVHHRVVRPGRDRGAGGGQPRRVLRAQADARVRQGRGDPARPRFQAHQDGFCRRWTHREHHAHGRRFGGRPPSLLHRRRRRDGTRALRRRDRAALWAADGYRVGQGRAGRGSTFSRPAPRR